MCVCVCVFIYIYSYMYIIISVFCLVCRLLSFPYKEGLSAFELVPTCASASMCCIMCVHIYIHVIEGPPVSSPLPSAPALCLALFLVRAFSCSFFLASKPSSVCTFLSFFRSTSISLNPY